jgi:hypothetical protein
MSVSGPLQGLTIQVVELNPYAPRPFVLTEAAICIRDAIRAAGYAAEHVANQIEPGQPALVLNPLPSAVPAGMVLDRRGSAVFNFEQLVGTTVLAGPDYRRWLRDRLVLDYHSSNVELLRRENGPQQQAFEVPMVPTASLALPLPEPDEKSVDVQFFGTPSPRREAVLEGLRAAGLSVEMVAGAYAQELAPAVLRARLVLHVHFYESALFPVVRFLQPVARGIPIVCEASVFSGLTDWSGSGVLFAPYEQLVAACVALLRSPQEQRERGERARAFARTIDFATPFHSAARAWQDRLAPAAPPVPVAPPAPATAQRGAAPVPVAPPVTTPAPPPAAMLKASRPPEEEDRLLTNSEIEAILAQEAAELPEAHLPAPEPGIVKREPGQGRFGRWVAWLLILFSLLTILQTMR